MGRSRMLVMLGALVAMGALVVPASVAAATPSAAAGLPALVNGKKAGPVTIRTTQRTVASLALTKGRWLVFAKAIIVGTGGQAGARLGVDCRLKIGSRSDLVTAVPSRRNGPGSRVPILLTAAGKLKRSGSTTVSCKAQVGGATKIREIRVTAFRVGKLTTRATVAPAGSRGPSATSGKGKPVVISAKQGSPRSITGDLNFYPIARLPLPAGLWWIVLKGVADEGSSPSANFSCALEVDGSTIDEVRLPLRQTGNPGDAQPLALMGAHELASSGQAELSCYGEGDLRFRNVVIDAIDLGTLTEDPGGTTGSGNPRLVLGSENLDVLFPAGDQYTTILSQPLPKGKWLVIAKAGYDNDIVAGDAQVVCQLGWSGVKDQVEFRTQGELARLGLVVLQVAASSPGGQSAVLRCKKPEGSGAASVQFNRIAAFKVGSILAWPL